MHKTKQYYVLHLALLALATICNYFAHSASIVFCLPVRFDDIGTFLVAAVYGPVWGSLCGLAYSIIAGLLGTAHWFYILPHVLVGFIVGHRYPRTDHSMLQVAGTAAFTTIVSTFSTTLLNLIVYDGYTNNLWGNALFDMVYQGNNFLLLSAIAGEALINMPDKVLSLFLIAFLLRFRTS